MEAYFDNQSNVLNAHIRIWRDGSVIYTVKTTFGLHGRMVTVLHDENPVLGGPTRVGRINWRKKTFEISGCGKAVSDVRRTEGCCFLKRSEMPFRSFYLIDKPAEP